MKKIFYLASLVVIMATIICAVPLTTKAESLGLKLSGRILLAVQTKGEAWYINPLNQKRYFLGRPNNAFELMRAFGLGISNKDFNSFNGVAVNRLAGRILIKVEDLGKAYYINPLDLKLYYLGRPADAFALMRKLGLGINNSDLNNIQIGLIDKTVATSPANQSILISNVPFTSQAPYGNWADSRQENGCEEASALMAIRWVKGEGLTKDAALKEIIAISDFTLKKYGEFRDVSAQNTVDWIFKDYFKYNKVKLINDISLNDIINELDKGNVVIAPMDGQLLHNPYYKAPGPARHMIVIRGYDALLKQFITNDPGTRNGELYHYDAAILYGAIRDYPTGYHETIIKVRKDVIIVSK